MPKRVCDRAVWSVFQHKCNHKSPSLPGSLLNQCDIALNGNRELPLFRREQSYDICANLRKKIMAAAAAAGVGVTAAENNNNNTNTNMADPPGGVGVTAANRNPPPGGGCGVTNTAARPDPQPPGRPDPPGGGVIMLPRTANIKQETSILGSSRSSSRNSSGE